MSPVYHYRVQPTNPPGARSIVADTLAEAWTAAERLAKIGPVWVYKLVREAYGGAEPVLKVVMAWLVER